MSGAPRRGAPLRWTVGRVRAGIVAIGRGAALAALALAALIPLAALLVLALTPLWGTWVAITLDGVPQRRRFVEGLQLADGGWFTQLVNLPTEAVRPIFGDGFFRAVCLVLTALALAVIPLAAPRLLAGLRQVSSGVRTLSGRWAGVPIPFPYRPYPGHGSRFQWLLSDPATWRDLCWTTVNATIGLLLSLMPGAVAAYGALNMLQGLLALRGLPGNAGIAAELLLRGVGLAALGLSSAPVLLRCYGLLARLVLARPGTDELNQRITHLTQTRAETIDASASEIRRIERDLHDGAQARLVAIGMALDAAEQLLGTQPDTARELLRDARGNSAQALAELRGLVRGIHPPVLADRGLTDAVRTLALEAPLPVSVHSDLTGRLPAPVESAAYFTVSELLANVAKHARATSATVRIRTGERLLAVTVADNGCGGADPSAGTGLRGLQRRLAAFDGTLTIDSPPGGPTAITLELPCAP
ncbi:MAG TPA: histidine kinase [Trebonia sp.]|nr:histidine kinase [Trebonia sp.]